MHDSVLTWTAGVLAPEHVEGLRVLEVGSYNVNGSVRPIVEALGPASYLGIDIETGPGVDEVCHLSDARNRFGRRFDLVICTEVLEHVVDWRAAMLALAGLVETGGRLLATTRSPGFPYHPYPIDSWRYTVDALGGVAEHLGFVVERLESDPQAPGVFLLALKMRVGVIPAEVAGITAMVGP